MVFLVLLFLGSTYQAKTEEELKIKFSEKVKALDATNYEQTVSSGKYFVLYYQHADKVTTSYINAIENYIRKTEGTPSEVQFAQIELQKKTEKIFNTYVPQALPAFYYSHYGYLISTHDAKINDKTISEFIEKVKTRKVPLVDGLQRDSSQFVIYFYSEAPSTVNRLEGLKIAHNDVGVYKVKSRAGILKMLTAFKIDTAPLADKDVIFGLRTSDNSVFVFDKDIKIQHDIDDFVVMNEFAPSYGLTKENLKFLESTKRPMLFYLYEQENKEIVEAISNELSKDHFESPVFVKTDLKNSLIDEVKAKYRVSKAARLFIVESTEEQENPTRFIYKGKELKPSDAKEFIGDYTGGHLKSERISQKDFPYEKNKVNEISGLQFGERVLGHYGKKTIAIVLFYNSGNLAAGPAFKKLVEEEFLTKIPKVKFFTYNLSLNENNRVNELGMKNNQAYYGYFDDEYTRNPVWKIEAGAVNRDTFTKFLEKKVPHEILAAYYGENEDL